MGVCAKKIWDDGLIVSENVLYIVETRKLGRKWLPGLISNSLFIYTKLVEVTCCKKVLD